MDTEGGPRVAGVSGGEGPCGYGRNLLQQCRGDEGVLGKDIKLNDMTSHSPSPSPQILSRTKILCDLSIIMHNA